MKAYIPLPLLTIVLLSAAPQIHADMHSSDKTTAKEIQQKAAETTNAIRDYTVENRDEAAKKVEAKLNSLDARIEALEGRIYRNWDRMDKAARERAQSTLMVLRRQRITVAEWYGSLKNSSSEAWEHMKKGFSDAFYSLRNSWEKAEKEY